MDSILDCVEDGHQKEGMERSRMKGKSDDFQCISPEVFYHWGNLICHISVCCFRKAVEVDLLECILE